MKKFNAIKIAGLAGLALSGLAALVGNWVHERQMEQMIDEKLEKALAKREENEEES